MKLLLVAASALALTSTLAVAADLPAPPAAPVVDMATSNWSFYAGINAGVARANRTGTSTDIFFPAGQTFDYDLQGGLIGAQAGFDYILSDKFVVGVEVSADAANIKGDDSSQVTGGGPGTYTWLAMGLGKAGFAVSDKVQIYGTAGVAMAGFSFDGSAGCAFNETRTGGTLGIGASFQATHDISLDASYNHVWFPSQTTPCTALGFDPVTNTSTSTADIVKVGLNYHFN